jgi:hypothetical protein
VKRSVLILFAAVLIPMLAFTARPSPGLSVPTPDGNRLTSSAEITQPPVSESGTLALFGLALIALAAIVCRRKPSQESVTLMGETENQSMDYGLSQAVAAARSLSAHLDSGFYRAGHASVRVIPSIPVQHDNAIEEPIVRAGNERRQAAQKSIAIVDRLWARAIRIAHTEGLRSSATSELARSAGRNRLADQRDESGSLSS